MSFSKGQTKHPLLCCAMIALLCGCYDQATGGDDASREPMKAVAQGTPATPPAMMPGELVVKFRSTGDHAVTDCMATRLEQKRSLASATADGSDSLDRLVGRLRIHQAKTLLPGRKGLTTARFRALRSSKMRARIAAPEAEIPDLTNVYLLRFPKEVDVAAAAAALANDPHVEYAHPNYRFKANFDIDDPYYFSSGSWGQPDTLEDLWGLYRINANPAWDVTRGEGVVVAVVDSGVDLTHPDLVDNIWTNPNEIINGIDDDNNGYVDDVNGWDMVNDDNDPTDDCSHGTHVSGTIAADNNDYGIVGVAPDARIMAVKALERDCSANTFALAQGIAYAAETGAQVINNSWGFGDEQPPEQPILVLEDAIVTAHTMGATVVFASGNDEKDIENQPIKSFPYSIIVGASNPSDERPDFSNWGEIDVVAPGAGYSTGTENQPERAILSLRAAEGAMVDDGLVLDTYFLRESGTSMAAPHVSGLAALILSVHPDYTPEMVRQVIRRNATDLGAPGFDELFGYGRIDAAAAIASTETPLSALITSPTRKLVHGQPITINGIATGDGFARYDLSFGPGTAPTEDELVPIAGGTQPVNGGALGEWNITADMVGPYTLLLVVTDQNGHEFEDRHRVRFDDLSISAPSTKTSLRGGEIIEITGTASAPDLTHYTVTITDVADGITLPDDGQNPVENGLLATWDTSGLSNRWYQITLTAYYQSGTSQSTSVDVTVDPDLHEGWPVTLNDNPLFPMTSATLADLDNDGTAEIVVGHGEVNVLRHDGTSLPGWPRLVDPSRPRSFTLHAPALGDIDGDGQMEVVASNNMGQIAAWHVDGSALPGYPIQEAPFGHGAIALADVDNDGVLDIVSNRKDFGLHVRRGSGEYLPGWDSPPIVGSNPPNGSTVADLDGDGDAEIVVSYHVEAPGTASPMENVAVFNAVGDLAPGFPKSLDSPSGHTVGDLDGDGDLEIVVTTQRQTVYAYHHDGSDVSRWPVFFDELEDNRLGHPTAGDIDGDGRAEIAFGEYSLLGRGRSLLHLLDNAEGEELEMPGWPVSGGRAIMPLPYSACALVDVDEDSLPEILSSRTTPYTWSSGGPIFEVIHSDGTKSPTYSKTVSSGDPAALDTTPAVADTDGDGLLEAVWIGSDGVVYQWDTDIDAANAQPWPMYMGNPQHSGYNRPLNGVLIPALIEAEDYVRYYDTTPGNTGEGCDTEDDVDKEITGDSAGGGCNVGWTEGGEWLEYDIAAAETGVFDITLRLASELQGRSCRVEIDGVDVSGSVVAPALGWQTYEDRVVENVTITQGEHVVRVTMETGLLNINYLVFSEAAADGNLGPEHTTTVVVVDGDALLTIDQWPEGWTPGEIAVGFSPVDGEVMDGMSVTMGGQTTPLGGWWQQVNVPYTGQDEILIALHAPTEREITVQWWAQ